MRVSGLVSIRSASVDAWEYRADSAGGETRFVVRCSPHPHPSSPQVFRISLADSAGIHWTVHRRYSDFGPFDVHVRRLLPELRAALPPREILRPLAGILGWGAAAREPSPAFVEERRRALDEYVRSILATAGGSKTSLWNHPAVLTFFDIPSAVHSHDAPASLEASCPIPLADWDAHLAKAAGVLAEAAGTHDRALHTAARGHDATNYHKHLRRQMGAVRKHVDRLQVSLDCFVRLGKVGDDDRLSAMSARLQDLAGRLERLDAAHCQQIPARSGTHVAVGEPPVARTPVRATGGSIGSAKKPPAELSPETQDQIIRAQDAQLSELSSIIQRHRGLGEAIGAEIEEQNQALDRIHTSVSTAQTKLSSANRRVGKL